MNAFPLTAATLGSVPNQFTGMVGNQPHPVYNVGSIPETPKQIVVVVDATSNFQPFISEIAQNFLISLLQRYFEATFQGNDNNVANLNKSEVAIVLFKDYPPESDYLVRTSSFTSDLRDLRTWLSSASFLSTSSTSPYYKATRRPIVEGLCAATKLLRYRESLLAKTQNTAPAKQKHIILLTNSTPNDNYCKSCDNFGDAFAHAARLGKAGICFSVISPKPYESLQRLFEVAHLDDSSAINEITTHLGGPGPALMLRGLALSIPTTSPAVSEAPKVIATAQVSVESPPVATPAPVAASPVKAIWEGNLAWPHTQNTPQGPQSITAHFEAIIIPSGLRPETDTSVFTASEWPATLQITGYYNNQDPSLGLEHHVKTAKIAEISHKPGHKNETAYKTLFQMLSGKFMIGIVQLPSRTMLILAHKTKRLICLIIPKLTKAPAPVQTVGAVSVTSVPANPTAPINMATNPQRMPLTGMPSTISANPNLIASGMTMTGSVPVNGISVGGLPGQPIKVQNSPPSSAPNVIGVGQVYNNPAVINNPAMMNPNPQFRTPFGSTVVSQPNVNPKK
mmetsp:Transcript_15121/g.21102  ORF Transcript_15121/g.21102 Transcript_15121/m.21102 type:complete len:566 (+) Transcript_15121:97-1794(+)